MAPTKAARPRTAAAVSEPRVVDQLAQQIDAKATPPSHPCPQRDVLPVHPAADQYDAMDDFAKSLDVGYAAIRERMARDGPGWTPSHGGAP
jgi:hypothetical protein